MGKVAVTMTPLDAELIRQKTMTILNEYGIDLLDALPGLADVARQFGTPDDCSTDRSKALMYLDGVTTLALRMSTAGKQMLTLDEAKYRLTGGKQQRRAGNEYERIRIGDLFKDVIAANKCGPLYSHYIAIAQAARAELGLNAEFSQYKAFFENICQKYLRGEGIPQWRSPFGGKDGSK